MARSQWMDAGASQTAAGQARRGAVVALSFSLAMAFGLAACTTSKPSPTPSTRSTASAAVSTTPVPIASPTWEPVRPDATKGPGLDGAIATARFFLSLYPYVYQTGNLSEWKAMSHPDCEFCKSVSENVTEMVANGSRTIGGDVDIVEVTRVEHNDSLTLAEVILRASQASSTDVHADGTKTPAGKAGKFTMHVFTIWSSGAWQVRGVNPERDPT